MARDVCDFESYERLFSAHEPMLSAYTSVNTGRDFSFPAFFVRVGVLERDTDLMIVFVV